MSRKPVLALDRMPHRVGLHATDWAGMQLARLWATPLVERRAVDSSYRLVGLESVERLDVRDWRLVLRAEVGYTAREAISCWRENAEARGGAAFAFMSRANSESESAIVVTTRHDYRRIEPFLDAYDLWLGLGVASERAARATKDRDDVIFPARRGTARVTVVRDISAARDFEFAHPEVELICCALPGPFSEHESPMTTGLAFALVPRRVGSAARDGSLPDILRALACQGSFANGFAPSDGAGLFLSAKTAKRHALTISATDFFPNLDVANAVACGLRHTMPRVSVRVALRRHEEEYVSHCSSDYNLAILVPPNDSPTGELRALINLAAPELSDDVVGGMSRCVDQAEITECDDDLDAARSCVYRATGIGVLGHYMAVSGSRRAPGVSASHAGIVPLERCGL